MCKIQRPRRQNGPAAHLAIVGGDRQQSPCLKPLSDIHLLCKERLPFPVQELKAKKAEMARLRIQLQQAENRNIKLAQEAAERERKRKESAEFEVMKQKVLQLERLVAENAAINPSVVRFPYRLSFSRIY